MQVFGGHMTRRAGAFGDVVLLVARLTIACHPKANAGRVAPLAVEIAMRAVCKGQRAGTRRCVGAGLHRDAARDRLLELAALLVAALTGHAAFGGVMTGRALIGFADGDRPVRVLLIVTSTA